MSVSPREALRIFPAVKDAVLMCIKRPRASLLGRTWPSGQLTWTTFFNLLEGVLRLYKLLQDGRRQIVGFALPGDSLGMAAPSRHALSADAIGPVVVCRFSGTGFARFAEEKPHLTRRINEFAVRELNQAPNHMVLLGRRSAEENVASFLIG